MNLFKHKVSHMSRPTNTTDESKDKFKAFTLKNIKILEITSNHSPLTCTKHTVNQW